MRRRIRSVTVIPEGDTLGRATLTKWPSDLHPDRDRGRRTRAWIEREIITLLGGTAAVERLVGRFPKRGTETDWRVAFNLITHLAGSEEETDAYMEWLWVRTKDLVDLYWFAVEALAAELLARRRVGERRAREVIAKERCQS